MHLAQDKDGTSFRLLGIYCMRMEKQKNFVNSGRDQILVSFLPLASQCEEKHDKTHSG
jgi:hypothetical protein